MQHILEIIDTYVRVINKQVDMLITQLGAMFITFLTGCGKTYTLSE